MTTPTTYQRLTIVDQAVDRLIENLHNARTHSDKQVDQIARSVTRFKFNNPILVDANNTIIAGHGRLLAAKKLGLETVPTICLAHMSEAEIRAYVIADNKLAENAGWDRHLLALEFDYLSKLELEFDLGITGFELPEIDVLIGELSLNGEGEADPADDAVEVASVAVTKPGDVWIIGEHRLICGDSTKAETFQKLMGNERAQMVFCDAPYNVPISGHVCGLGKVQHREFAMASGEMSRVEFTGFLTTIFKNLADFSVDGSIHYQCMDLLRKPGPDVFRFQC